MFSCFQKTLFYAEIVTENETNYDDPRTFMELKKRYRLSLGRLGLWRNLFSLRCLNRIEPVQVQPDGVGSQDCTYIVLGGSLQVGIRNRRKDNSREATSNTPGQG